MGLRMNRDAFEQLVSAWLDEPDRADLRTRIEAAAQADPELARLLNEWRRFDDLFRHGVPEAGGVDWTLLKTHVATAIDRNILTEQARDHALDEALRGLPGVDSRVDWPRFHERIASALTRSAGQAASHRRRYTMVAGGAVMLAAAAALIFAFLPVAGPGVGSPGLALVTLGPPPAAQPGLASGVAYARITTGRPAEAQPERFFVIDPVKAAAPSNEAPDYY